MAILRYVLAFVAFSASFASDVPVLMWSSERPLSDLPQAPATDSVPQDSFHATYLKPLLGKESQVLVAFLQDKLHINDISKYADVYNQDSVGGAFKNIKSLLDENFSLELPRVLGSHLAVHALRKTFPGTVHDLTATSDLAGLDLGGEDKYLLIVRLAPVIGANNEEAAIAGNDEVIGQVTSQLKKKGVKYTALYTAETSEERQKRSSRQARHLLETPTVSSEGVFYNVSYGNGTLYAYLQSFSICLITIESPAQTSCNVNFTINAQELKDSNMTAVDVGNRTISANLTLKGLTNNATAGIYDVSIALFFEHQFDRWEIKQSELLVMNGTGTGVPDVIVGNNATYMMVTRGYDPVVSLLYSYHCSSMEWYPKNLNLYPKAYIVLGGFQIQPYNSTSTGFTLSQDCVGWFSTPIWMALVPVGLNILVLLFGMYMLSSLTTNDRFDDPKGKPLVINAAE